ncbi:unnamed protein product [Pelagomonas calceolata]|uniref:Uncharacterized protein n=2 Tax=Pelagomonas calceolata TaxID=35677 RepID=A0A8J2SS97_9STRA|nr:unnamed protein product [Pelagomonas calceolata]
MALSERSLRDLRKIADLDAKTEAAHAAQEVADRRATALQDALAERAGRIAALERACRLPVGEDDDGAAAALEAAAEVAERDAVAAELAAAADARRAAEDRAAAATSRSESAESRVAGAALEARLASLQRDAMATAQSEGGAAMNAATAAADAAAEAAADARALALAETTKASLERQIVELRDRLIELARDRRFQICRANAADAAAQTARRRASRVVDDANRCAAEVRRCVARDAERAALLERVAELEAEVALRRRPRTPSPEPSPEIPVPTPAPEKPASEPWTSDAVLDAAWTAEFKRAERVASKEKERERARHLRDWAQLAVRRDEQRRWTDVLRESTERIEPAGVLTYSLKEVFELPAD